MSTTLTAATTESEELLVERDRESIERDRFEALKLLSFLGSLDNSNFDLEGDGVSTKTSSVSTLSSSESFELRISRKLELLLLLSLLVVSLSSNELVAEIPFFFSFVEFDIFSRRVSMYSIVCSVVRRSCIELRISGGGAIQ